MPIGSSPDPRNLITKLAGYKRVVDVANSVTIVDDLAAVVVRLLELRATGTFHGTNPGAMKHRELLALYKELVDPEHEVEMITEEELSASGLIQKSRSNCLLRSDRLKELGIEMRPIDVALRATMVEYAKAMRG